MAVKKIMVTGSNGQLGSELRALASQFPQYQFIFLTRADLSISDATSAARLFEQYQPDYLVNCAAYTAVDQAETEIEQANEINGKAVGILATLCKTHNTRFIHISTDYVFNGDHQSPWKENDPVDPVNSYGASKLLGEQLAQEKDPDCIIIRTSWVYSSYGKNFVKTMMRLMKERESIKVVNDQVGSPTYAADLAQHLLQIIQSGNWVPGIYHYSNEGIISWFDFATEIRDMIHASCSVLPIPSEQFPTPARRPKYSVMDTTKIKQTYSLQLYHWKESLRRCLDKLDN